MQPLSFTFYCVFRRWPRRFPGAEHPVGAVMAPLKQAPPVSQDSCLRPHPSLAAGPGAKWRPSYWPEGQVWGRTREAACPLPAPRHALPLPQPAPSPSLNHLLQAAHSASPSFWWSTGYSTPSWSWTWRPREGVRGTLPPPTSSACISSPARDGSQAPLGPSPLLPRLLHPNRSPLSLRGLEGPLSVTPRPSTAQP